MMTIEDRVRRLLAAAVAQEPPPLREPLDRVLSRRPRRRPRPALVGAVLMAIVLGGAVAFAAVRGGGRPASPARPPSTSTAVRPPPSTSLPTRAAQAVPSSWRQYRDPRSNLSFFYPPGWVVAEVSESPRVLQLRPPEYAKRPISQSAPFHIAISVIDDYYVGEVQLGATLARWANGREYRLVVEEPPAAAQRLPGVAYSWAQRYAIDWGRDCADSSRSCAPSSVRFEEVASSRLLFDRYRTIGDTVAGSAAPLRPVRPSTGDRTRPACRSDQYAVVGYEEIGLGSRPSPHLVVEGNLRYLRGPACHLRVDLGMQLEGAGGRLLAVDGNPSSTAIEGDLPEDGVQVTDGSMVVKGKLMWRLVLHRLCGLDRPPRQVTVRVVSEQGPQVAFSQPLASQVQESQCGARDAPSQLAAWP